MKFDKNNNLEWNIDEEPINFPKKIRVIYEKHYIKNRIIFTNWLNKFNKKYCLNIDWWMTLPPTRDPYKSALLNYFCVIDTLEKIKSKNLKIKTKSNEFAKILKNKFNVLYEIEKKQSISSIQLINNFIKGIFFQCMLFLYINLSVEKKKIKEKKIGLIDIFVTINKKQNKNFYANIIKKGGLVEYFFVPTFIPTYNIFRIFAVINSLKNEEANYFFKEHYLKFSDLIFSFFHIFRKNKFIKNDYYYKKVNISKVVNYEIKSNNDFNSVFIGILNYRFFYRISKKKLNVHKTINWFENQMVDKGWNLGFRQYFKKFEKNSFGKQDYSKHYNMISNSPSISEENAKVVPKNIITISNLFLKSSKEFNKKQKILLGKSWRFRDLKRLKNSLSKKNKKKYLLVLSGIKKIDKILLDFVISISPKLGNIKILVKPHPILNVKKIINISTLPKNIIVINDDLQKTLVKTLVVITSGPSSTILESSQLRAYLIIPNIEAATYQNALRHKLKKKEYAIVNNPEELLEKIKKFN